jgi:NSS family neurotransmitter:Na+ symporter
MFNSRLGFILAAAGSAVGLGNIWGFPTQAAQNGGAAFVLMYLILAFCLAYPAFMAELLIGRYGQANAVESLTKMSNTPAQTKFAFVVGFGGILCAALLMSFYSIVAGWMIAYTAEPVASVLGATEVASWLTTHAIPRNLVFTAIFTGLTILIIRQGVADGIEKWSKRLMPALVILLVSLTIYVLTLDGASEGLEAYLIPDFSQLFDADLIVSALGQAFFSLSLGTSVIIIYGSYVSRSENIVSLGAYVTLIDVFIAFLAGLLIIPAMYVAQAQGVEIFASDGSLLSGDTLVFTVLPSLFNSMGAVGYFVAFAFFCLMSIAALTSSISMLEAPVSYCVERFKIERKQATVLTGLLIFAISVIIIFNFGELFGLVIAITTQYGQPIIGMLCCIFVGWIWNRSSILEEVKQGNEGVENSLFWKIWPWYTKIVCPLAIAMVFAASL